MTILTKAAYTTAKAEFAGCMTSGPLGLGNELNVKCPSRVRLRLVWQNAAFGLCTASAVCEVWWLQIVMMSAPAFVVCVCKHKQRVTQQQLESIDGSKAKM